MASVNTVIIVGNLGRDPEIRYMPKGDAIANIAVAKGLISPARVMVASVLDFDGKEQKFNRRRA